MKQLLTHPDEWVRRLSKEFTLQKLEANIIHVPNEAWAILVFKINDLKFQLYRGQISNKDEFYYITLIPKKNEMNVIRHNSENDFFGLVEWIKNQCDTY